MESWLKSFVWDKKLEKIDNIEAYIYLFLPRMLAAAGFSAHLQCSLLTNRLFY